jgi:hypothetical protein
MSDIENKPLLRISPNVYGRTDVKNRVKYLIDPKGEGAKTAVPDLFLYASHLQTGKPSIARFVEVKRPGEKVTKDQRNEIELLNFMGHGPDF